MVGGVRRKREGEGDLAAVLVDDLAVNFLIVVGHQEHFLRLFAGAVEGIHILRALRIRPRNLRHRAVDDLRQTAGVGLERQFDVHRIRKRSSGVQVGDELGVHTDVAVAEVIDEHIADVRAGELVDGLGAGRRVGEVHLAVLEVVDFRALRDGLIAEILDVRRAEHKAVVRHKVNDAVGIELRGIGRHRAGAVAGDIRAGAHRDDVLFNMLLEFGAVELHAEVLLAVRRSGQLGRGVVVHRHNLNRKIPNRLGVDTVDDDGQSLAGDAVGLDRVERDAGDGFHRALVLFQIRGGDFLLQRGGKLADAVLGIGDDVVAVPLVILGDGHIRLRVSIGKIDALGLGIAVELGNVDVAALGGCPSAVGVFNQPHIAENHRLGILIRIIVGLRKTEIGGRIARRNQHAAVSGNTFLEQLPSKRRVRLGAGAVDDGLHALLRGLGELGVLVRGSVIAEHLIAVRGQALNVHRVQSARAAVRGVQILIDREEQVLAGDGRAVGKGQAVLEDEFVGGRGLVLRHRHRVGERIGLFVQTRYRLGVLVRGDELELRHRNDVRVVGARRVKRVELAVGLQRADDQRRGGIVAGSRRRVASVRGYVSGPPRSGAGRRVGRICLRLRAGRSGDQQRKAEQKRQNSLDCFHTFTS